MGQLDGLPGWGTRVKVGNANESLTVAQVNNRVNLLVGRNGSQLIALPNSTQLITGAAVQIIGDDPHIGQVVGGLKQVVTITDGVATFYCSTPTGQLTVMWTGTAWEQITEKPNLWGTVVTPGNVASYSIHNFEANAGIIVRAGRNGAQSVYLPGNEDPEGEVVDLIPGVVITVIASDSHVSSDNAVTIVTDADPVTLSTVGTFQTFLWDGFAWVYRTT